MSRIHSKDTRPEILVRKELFRRGFRYRLNVRRLPGSPDIVLSRYRTAIFINGCFWHGHEGCRLYVMPKSNVDFWRNKITNNRKRDQIAAARLEALAWNVITVWECELSPSRLRETVDGLEISIRENEARWTAYREKKKRDRTFAMAQSRRRKEIMRQIGEELGSDFPIPDKIRRIADEDAFSALDAI